MRLPCRASSKTASLPRLVITSSLWPLMAQIVRLVGRLSLPMVLTARLGARPWLLMVLIVPPEDRHSLPMVPIARLGARPWLMMVLTAP
ncbi:hypothetical protein [Pseudomonas thivervalensis]|uniref:hypothetical protein n=1 Tax=Pseudomonas thivervalensis TaxID=86265 RepID=UPI00087A506C|nr:hypothetical protein [Pseudomonas thivervalensis]SDG90488.1 hypothetical protein SAMN04490204_6101 [Pseudomonas thivervalensis]